MRAVVRHQWGPSRRWPCVLTGRRLVGGLLLWLCATVAQAANLSVNPVLITLDASDSIAAMTVTNQGEGPVVMQASVNAWSIRDNQEHYEPTTALLVNPPVFEVAPGQRQILRVGLRDTEPKAVEQSFRVFLEQAPATPGDDANTDRGGSQPRGVQVMLRLGIPVFVAPAAEREPALQWQAERLAAEQLRIEAVNQGNVHAKVSRLTLRANEKTVAARDLSSYILPGSRRHWLLKIPADTTAPYHVQAETNAGMLDTTIASPDLSPSP